MEITFAQKRMEKLMNSQKDLVRRYGKQCADRIRRRLDDIAAAPTLAVLKRVHPRTHALKGARAGLVSVDLEHPLRLLFRPVFDEGSGSEFDWASVTAVEIVSIEDTHG